jgi:hypothetical protein
MNSQPNEGSYDKYVNIKSNIKITCSQHEIVSKIIPSDYLKAPEICHIIFIIHECLGYSVKEYACRYFYWNFRNSLVFLKNITEWWCLAGMF